MVPTETNCKKCGKRFKNCRAMAGHSRIHYMTDEKRQKYSAVNNRRWARPGYKESQAVKDNIQKMVAASGKIFTSAEYRQACSKAQVIRFSRQEEREKLSIRFSGSGNPRWNPDRQNQDAQISFIERIRRSMKQVKRGIFSGLLDYTWPELGFTSRQLKEHIEKQFTQEMTWKNWGTTWYIDHIVPVSRWDISSTSNEVNALSNLRPLLVFDNLSKGGKLDEELVTR